MRLVCLRCRTVFLFEGKVGIRKIIENHRCPRCDSTLISYKSRISKKREAWRYRWRKVYVGYKYVTILNPNTFYLMTTRTSYWIFPKFDKGVIAHGKKRTRIKLRDFPHSLQIRIKALYHFDKARYKVEAEKNKKYIRRRG